MANLPKDAVERKQVPLATGVLDYFPDALAAVAEVSRVGNDQHNPGQPLHWDKTKSLDHADSLLRHLVDRGSRDNDGVRHSAKAAWRALALLQTEIENEQPVQTQENPLYDSYKDIPVEYKGTGHTIRDPGADLPGDLFR